MSILIPVGVGVIFFVSYLVIRAMRKKSKMNDSLINNTA